MTENAKKVVNYLANKKIADQSNNYKNCGGQRYLILQRNVVLKSTVLLLYVL